MKLMDILTFVILPITLVLFSISCFQKGLGLIGIIMPVAAVLTISYFYN